MLKMLRRNAQQFAGLMVLNLICLGFGAHAQQDETSQDIRAMDNVNLYTDVSKRTVYQPTTKNSFASLALNWHWGLMREGRELNINAEFSNNFCRSLQVDVVAINAMAMSGFWAYKNMTSVQR